jgi:type II secretory pathway pseudopilin PulG
MSEEIDEIKVLFRAYLKWIIGLLAVITLFSVIWFIGGRSVQVADNAIIHYEEFQEIYNSAQAFNQKLCNIKGIKADDAMFKDFSQAAQINGLRNNLTRWIEEYNAKSKMWNRSLWKSNALPYQLSTSDFNCY